MSMREKSISKNHLTQAPDQFLFGISLKDQQKYGNDSWKV